MPGAFVRRIDPLGRILIPSENRERLGHKDGSPVEYFLDGERIVLALYRLGRVFCGSLEGLEMLHHRLLCGSCAEEPARLFSMPVVVSPERQGRVGPRTTLVEERPNVDGPSPVERVRDQLPADGWQVDDSGRAGKSVDLVASKGSRVWYLQVRPCTGPEPVWPSGHEAGWFKGAARRADATAVLAFVCTTEPEWTVEVWSAHALGPLSA